MTRVLRPFALFAAAAVALSLLAVAPLGAASPCDGRLCAGAADVALPWHVGQGQGQLGSTPDTRFDPFHHSTKLAASHGVQSTGLAKAVVLRGADGTKVAYVKTDVYLQHDLLSRRVAQLVTGGDLSAPEYAVPELDAGGIMLAGTHNHSAPHYTSTAWGVWVFADAFDLRAFELTARAIAASIKRADAALAPATVGASVTRVRGLQQNILGPATADDGSPAGFPRDWYDPELAVVRIDRADGSGPIAAIVNFAMHPESIGSRADLLSADFIGMVERDVERALGRAPGQTDGPVVAWGQGGLGDVEPDDARATPADAGRVFWRRDFAQTERMTRMLSAAVVGTWNDVAAHTPDVPGKYVAPSADVPVKALDMRFPGPPAHPAPTASNCRTERPGVPIAGLPDCQRPPVAPPDPYNQGLRALREAGAPVPGNYGAPTRGAVQESTTIRLQAFRLGEILLATCPCEPITDMTVNFKSRTDAEAANQHLGYEWPCRPGGTTGVECDFRSAGHLPESWRPVNPEAHARMRAQIRNAADGWETDAAQLGGEAEPVDPQRIKGNFTHEELTPALGYRLPLMVGKGNDYIGYVVTYREYQRGDHYRKALTPFGPRTADYVNTRLVRMAAQLKGGPAVTGTVPADASELEDQLADLQAAGLGASGTGGLVAYNAAIPDDGGTPGRVVSQPDRRVQRFTPALLRWQGGSNWTDQPKVTVERHDKGGWRTVSTQEGGEVVVVLDYETLGPDPVVAWASGGAVYEWTAVYETTERTEPGRYRFRVEGRHRSGRAAVPYGVTSEPFDVQPWAGLEVRDLAVAGDAASFEVRGVESTVAPAEWVGPVAALPGDQVRYPFRNPASLPFLSGQLTTIGPMRYCFRCTFRAWATHGQVTAATVTVDRAQGKSTTHPAVYEDGRWVARGLALQPGDRVVIEPGAVRDQYGNTNS